MKGERVFTYCARFVKREKSQKSWVTYNASFTIRKTVTNSLKTRKERKMQNRFHTFTFFVFCIAKKICQENPAVIHYVGVRFPNGRNRKCPKENFSVCKYIF